MHASDEGEHTQSSSVRDRPSTAGRALARGDSVGRYIVLDVAGEGASAVVYRAYDTELDRRVALKVLHPRSITEAREERLLEEARTLGRLSHENIVTVFDAGRVGERVFVALELVAGCTLREWLSLARRRWTEIVAVFARAARGLAAAHEAGVVHRDFKLDNVLVGDDHRVRVADFGLARHEDPQRSRASSPPAGTPAYMAPELFDGAPSDARSDQYAFCVALHEALIGERPFRASSVEEQLRLARRGLAEHCKNPEIPEWLYACVRRGLDPDPTRRFSSLRALLEQWPDDPDADLRHSNKPRAALVAAVVSIQLALGLWLEPPGTTRARAPQDGRLVLLWIVFSAAIAAIIVARFRARLLATRTSRRVLAALAALYYTSVVVEFSAQRFAASEAHNVASTFLWAGACLFGLGLGLHSLFLRVAALSFASGALVLLWPSSAPWLSRVGPFAMAMVLIARWANTERAQRSSRSPNASSQR
ncbi:MAG: serine/threonine-protein kinase [Polyangiales bacterium]